MILKVTDFGRDHTSIAYEKVTIIEYGFDSEGLWNSVVCMGELPNGDVRLFGVGGHALHQDLLQHYKVW